MSERNFYLFCKSYSGDIARVWDLWKSIEVFNKDKIPFYVSIPQKELEYFKSFFGVDANKIIWVTDEEIIQKCPNPSLEKYAEWDGRLSQQVVKSEFWRLFKEDVSYLCLDSESQFIRDFCTVDFLLDGVPYTVFHQNKELLQLAENKKIKKINFHFLNESSLLKNVFKRLGPDYDFGPTPVIWSSKVWKSLETNYLMPNKLTLWDAIEMAPSELRWYGEALLAYKAIPIYPIEPIFRVYHYDWQYFTSKKMGETSSTLLVNYLGILKQSNWDYERDSGKQAKRKSFLSKVVRVLKRIAARFR
jgi:hypothetical protein